MLAPVRRYKSNRAVEICASILNAFHILEKKRVICGSIAVLASIARTSHSRSTAKRVHLKARIVRHAPFARMARCDCSHFDERVTLEIGSVFLYAFRIVGNDFVIRKNLRNLAQLMLIVGGYEKLHFLFLRE